MAKQTFTTGSVLTATQMNDLQTNDFNWTVNQKTTSYVLVASDKGTRIEMNSGSATTVTVNTGLFTAGDTLFIQNIGTGVCTVTAGTATVNRAATASLALAQWQGGYLYFISASSAVFFADAGYTPPLTTKGDLFTFDTANTRLPIGTTNNHVLTVDSTTATGMKWAAAPASDSVTLLSTTTLSGATSTTISPISSAYTHLLILIDDWAAGANADCRINLFGGAVIAFVQRKVSGTTYTATGGGGNTYFVIADTCNASADDFQSTILIPFYSQPTSRKTAQYWTGVSDNSTGTAFQEGAAAARNGGVGAVSSITISTSTATNMTGTVRIYGWK